MSNNHHYLPQFYLNGFVGEDEKLHYCRKQFDTYKDIYPAGIYYQKGLNSINLSPYGQIDLEKDFFLEKDISCLLYELNCCSFRRKGNLD